MRGLRLTYVNLAGYTVGDMSKSSESTQMLLIISATLRYYSNTARAVYFGRGARVDSFDR